MLDWIKSNYSDLKYKIKPERLETIAQGLYHFELAVPGEKSRVHLRVDGNGTGILIVNANKIMHLNPTAVIMAYSALTDTHDEIVLNTLTYRYEVSKSEAAQDYKNFRKDLNELIRADGACPIHDLDLEIKPPFSVQPSAPYRMDLALTYRCNNDCSHCYNARPRNYREISTDEWIEILDKLWNLGIPHVVFTGGEPTLREDLHILIKHAEMNGQITGLNTNGRRLSNADYLHELVIAGLDHVQITVESHQPEIHDKMVQSKGAWKQTIKGLENALDSPLFVMTNTTMLRNNSPFLSGTLQFLSSIGVPTVGLNALIYSGQGSSVGTGLKEKELSPLLDLARTHTDNHNQRLIWYTPTQYCHFDPMQLELGVKGCTAALYNMCIEPDAGIIPCQSYYQQLGNILVDPWENIWNHEISQNLRNRKMVPEKCSDCVLLPECGGGCPLIPQHPHTYHDQFGEITL